MADERARERILVLPVEEVEPPYAISRDGLHPREYDYGYPNQYQFHRQVDIRQQLCRIFADCISVDHNLRRISKVLTIHALNL